MECYIGYDILVVLMAVNNEILRCWFAWDVTLDLVKFMNLSQVPPSLRGPVCLAI
jgi:hypothetical protein